MRIQLSDHFSYKKLLRFVFPSIIMMIFTSIYGIVDGLFVSNFVGKTPFAAINLIMPILIILGAFGFMIGTGGTAIVGRTLGEKKNELANKYFSMLVYTVFIAGIVFSAIGIIFIRPLSAFLGAEGEMLDNCVLYGRIILMALPFFMLQNTFQSFFITAEKPTLGLWVTVIAGVMNMVLDALLVAVFPLGLIGAAIATAISQFTGAVIPIFYFSRNNDSLLKLTKTGFYGNVLLKSCTNGSSEMVSNIAASVVTMLYNFQLMEYAGENGVAAYGVIMYVNFIFAAVFIGYSIGVAPVISYNFGAQNHYELKNIFKKSVTVLLLCGICMFILSNIAALPMAQIFVGYDAELCNLTVRGFHLFSFSFLISGFCMFGSCLFTALNDGVVSAIISFMRTFVFQCSAILLMPFLMGIDGVWWSVAASEAGAFAVTVIFTIIFRKKYKYM